MNFRLFLDKRQKLVREDRWQTGRPPTYFAENQRSKWNGYLLTTLSKTLYRN